LFETLSSCTSLESLKFYISDVFVHSLSTVKKGIRAKGLAEAVRGLKSLTVKLPDNWKALPAPTQEVANTLTEEIKVICEEESTKERLPYNLNSKRFRKAVGMLSHEWFNLESLSHAA